MNVEQKSALGFLFDICKRSFSANFEIRNAF